MSRRPRQPERAKAGIPALDACAICRYRDEARHHGAAFCRGNFRRQHPTCTHDGRKPRFVPDLAAIESAKAGT